MSAPHFCFTQLPFKGQAPLQVSPVSAADKDEQTFGTRAAARARQCAIRQHLDRIQGVKSVCLQKVLFCSFPF